MVRVTDRQHRDAGASRFFHQQLAGSRQGRLRKTVGGIDPHKTRSHIFDDRNGLTIDPTTLQRGHISRNPEHAVTVRAIALGTGAVLRQHLGNLSRRAVTQENLLQQSAKRFE